MEQIYRNKYNIYNHLFYNVYYGKIGKQCFTPRWRCVSYMEIAPLLHCSPLPAVNAMLMKKVLHITQRKRKSNVHHYCKSDDFRAGLKYQNGECFVIQGHYKLALPASSKFTLTVPPKAIQSRPIHCKLV